LHLNNGDIAESILLALRNRGHEVFFSHDDLPPAGSFDLRIQKQSPRANAGFSRAMR
jgi:hypothetical protein